VSVAIHDKTPEGRRKLKEGPKAQTKYVEELQSEWIDNHATKMETVQEKRDVPFNIQQRYAIEEERTRCQLAEMHVEEQQRTAARAAASRSEVVSRIMRQEILMYGRVRETTAAEAESFGLEIPVD
jgi:hypothetical protein